MYVRIVTFRLDGIEPAAYRAHSEKIAPVFAAWPGLLSKVWLADGPGGRHGGVYTFADKESADASRDTDAFRGMTGNPNFTDLRVEEFDVLETPSAVTSAAR